MRVRLIIALVVVLGAAAPARAAFPGTNGLLAAQPSTGRGIVLIDPRTGRAHRICTIAAHCGRPVAPRWAPDGRQIVSIDAETGRTVVTVSNGACVACDDDRPLTTVPASNAAFIDDGTLLIARRGPARRVVTVPFAFTTTPPPKYDWSADAIATSPWTFAVTKRQSLWIGTIQLARWGLGTSASLAPKRGRFAFVRDGWVWLSNELDTFERRLVRGSAPAYSPDGRDVAYVGPDHVPYVIAVNGGKPRRVSRVRVRTLDWGRHPATTCDPPPSEVIGRTASAVVWKVVTTSSQFPDASDVSIFGCALSVGVPRLLADGADNTTTSDSFDVGSTALAGGDDVALLTHTFQKYIGVSDGIIVADLRTGHVLDSAADLCQNESYGCTAVDALQVNTRGFAAWHQWAGHDYPPGSRVQEQAVVADDNGIRAVDTVAPGDGHTLTNVVLGPDSVTWDDAGVPHSAPLQ